MMICSYMHGFLNARDKAFFVDRSVLSDSIRCFFFPT
jgi:hypothetical protein